MGKIEESDQDKRDTLAGLLMALCAGFLMSFVAVTTRALKATPTPVVIFHYAIGGLLLTSAYILAEMCITGLPGRFGDYTSRQMGIAIGASAFDTGALLSITIGYQCDSSGFVSMLSYLNIVYAFVCDQIVWHQTFNAIELICALTILVTALGIAIYKYR